MRAQIPASPLLLRSSPIRWCISSFSARHAIKATLASSVMPSLATWPLVRILFIITLPLSSTKAVISGKISLSCARALSNWLPVPIPTVSTNCCILPARSLLLNRFVALEVPITCKPVLLLVPMVIWSLVKSFTVILLSIPFKVVIFTFCSLSAFKLICALSTVTSFAVLSPVTFQVAPFKNDIFVPDVSIVPLPLSS